MFISSLASADLNFLDGSAAKDDIGDVIESVVGRRHPARAATIITNTIPSTSQEPHESHSVVPTEHSPGKLGALVPQVDFVLREAEPWQTHDFVELFSRSHPSQHCLASKELGERSVPKVHKGKATGRRGAARI